MFSCADGKALGPEFLLNSHAHKTFHLCATGNLLLGLTLASDGVLRAMATDVGFDGLESAGAPASAGVRQSAFAKVVFRVFYDEFSKLD
ncbi:unnamed protein product [Discula destructiva]